MQVCLLKFVKLSEIWLQIHFQINYLRNVRSGNKSLKHRRTKIKFKASQKSVYEDILHYYFKSRFSLIQFTPC